MTHNTSQTQGREIYLLNTNAEDKAGFPTAKAALAKATDSDLEFTRRIYQRASFGRNIFAGNAQPILKIIEAEISARKTLK
jgi:hypothetical protein